MKLKPKVYLFVTAILIPTVLMLAFIGCGQPTSSRPHQTNPQAPPSTIDNISPTPAVESPSAAEPQPTSEVNQVNIVYFHRTIRCYSCKYSEAQTLVTLDTYFADELAAGKISFVSVDVQDKSNATIIEKYGAYGPQLFISVLKGDTESITEVQEFWGFIGDDDGFSNLIIAKVYEALEIAGL